MTATAERVLSSAEGWIGTPYRHQGSQKGVGCDCLGLVRGVWREIFGGEPEVFAPYAPDWAERGGEERLLEAAARHFLPVAGLSQALPGDLLIFRWQAGRAAKHAGILARGPEPFGPRSFGPAGGTGPAGAPELLSLPGQPDFSGVTCGTGLADPSLRVDPNLGAGPLSAPDPAGAQTYFIHAYEQAAVIRSALVPSWRRRVAGVFRFPEM